MGGAIAAALIGVAGTAYSVSASQKAAKKQQAAQEAALEGNPFGSVPEGFPYEAVDFNREQLNAIMANRNALPDIQRLTSSTNNFITADALRRAQKLIPNYSASLAQLGANTGDLLSGRLPFDDVMDIMSDRSELSGGLGIPGTAGPATLKDLGISRLDAMGKGAGLLGEMVNIAETISPRSSYMRPQDSFINPLDRIRATMEQNVLKQQSGQNILNLGATADPNDIARAQIGIGNAGRGGGADIGAYATAAQQLIAGVSKWGTNQGYWGTPTPNSYGAYGTEGAASRAVEQAGGRAAGFTYDPSIQGWIPQAEVVKWAA